MKYKFGDQPFLAALQDTLVAPFGLVRPTQDSIQVSKVPILNLAGFAAVGVPFLYFSLALRNCLRSPAEDAN